MMSETRQGERLLMANPPTRIAREGGAILEWGRVSDQLQVSLPGRVA
jgi:hypothetical protein